MKDEKEPPGTDVEEQHVQRAWGKNKLGVLEEQ